jgi:hypothetical protein
MKSRLCACLCAFLLLVACSAALAQSDAVVVTALRDPVKKSYRKMLEGAKLFDERRHLAPAAELRFKLIPREPGAKMEGVELTLEGESLAIPLKVSPDRTFALEKNPLAQKEDAQVTPNRRAGTLTWRADVRTPGLPPNVRRLGDLRLECEVGMQSGLISNYPAGFFGWLEELLGKGPEFCHRALPRYLFFAERPVWSVSLVDGARREAVPIDQLYAGVSRDPKWKDDRFCDCQAIFDRTYFVPLGDPSWPDDTRVELEYMDDGEAGEITRHIARAVLGETMVLDFASGYEIWIYGDLVLLFDPAGTLTRARGR